MAMLTDFASRFFAWWLEELASCLPARLRGLRRRRAILAIAIREEEASFRLRKGEKWRTMGSVRLARSNVTELRHAFVSSLRGVSTRAVEIVVELPSERVLRRVVDLPIAAMENLREVLSFEMDRHTPFRAEEVSFDHRVVGTDPKTNRVMVDLAVVPLALVQQAAAVVAAFGVAADRIAIAGEAADATALNLLPRTAQAKAGGFGRKLSLALAATVVALAIAAVYL